MRVAVIQSEAGAAHDGHRSLKTARALRDAGHAVTLLVPQPHLQASFPQSAPLWQAEGFACIPISAAQLFPTKQHFPRDPVLAAARALEGIATTFDIAWFFEAEWAMPLLRKRRFSELRLPLVVLDEGTRRDAVPSSLQSINLDFARRYAAQWADLVLVPDALANQSIQQAETLWHQRPTHTPLPRSQPTTSPAVTVCVPYYEAPEYLAATLLSLANQTSTGFTVIVVDDGSHTPQAIAVFEQCATLYAARGWRFLRQPNQSAGAARNRAAAEATTEFLLFLDADDIAMPTMVARFLRAALITGDDCLVAPNYGFRDDPLGPSALLYDPPGNSLIASMGDDMHGGSCIFVRRSAFQQLGGFTELRGAGFEDYEFHVRANLAGLRWDVLPEFLYRYRLPRAGGVSRSTAAYPNLARVTRWYADRLQPHGLGQLPLAFAATYWANELTATTLSSLQRTASTRAAKPSPQGRELKLLLLTCNFPFGIVSGWHTRVQQMIKYFGARYQLTLMTSMPREQFAPLHNVAMQHLHAVLGVEGSRHTAALDSNTPARVREHYTGTFQSAIRSLNTDQYHAAIMDQVFMAEFRKDIDTLPILTEHNIESRLLRQAAARIWNAALPEHYRNAEREAVKLERYEDRAWQDIPLRAVVSEIDRAEIDRRTSSGKTVVASNGADLSTWLPNARFDANTVLFAGNLAYLPNVDAIEFLLTEIWPRVQRQRPQASLILAGRNPADSVRAAIANAGGAGIELCANPPLMEAVAQRASITIAPLRLGSGTRCKILDSMAWGLPVVSTTLGAEGIDVADEEHLLLRDDPQHFADAILRLLSDEPLWKNLRAASGALVRERYSWDRVFAPFEDALLELIS